MQHLDLPKRVVRWQGNWSSQGETETMPETYLRESQILILAKRSVWEATVRLAGEQLNPESRAVPGPGVNEPCRTPVCHPVR